jgi:hypothetical protein
MDDQSTANPPPRRRSCVGLAAAIGGILIAAAWLLNFTMGTDDILPIVGNLDEAAATALLLGCLRYLGIDITGWFNRFIRPPGDRSRRDQPGD